MCMHLPHIRHAALGQSDVQGAAEALQGGLTQARTRTHERCQASAAYLLLGLAGRQQPPSP